MNKLFGSCGLLFALSASVNAAELPFYVGQSHDGWAFNVTGKGRALAGETLIAARLDEIKVINNPVHEKDKWIDYVEVGYGYQQPDGKWNVEHVGARRAVGQNISPGEAILIKDVDATLSVNKKEISNYWVVIVVGTSKGSTIYAHSRHDLFN